MKHDDVVVSWDSRLPPEWGPYTDEEFAHWEYLVAGGRYVKEKYGRRRRFLDFLLRRPTAYYYRWEPIS